MSKSEEFDAENNPATLPVNDSVSNLDGLSSSALQHNPSEPNRIFLEDNELPEKHFSSVEEVVEYVGFGWFQLRLMLLTGLAVTADAMEMLTLSILAPALHCEWHLLPIHQAMITSVVFTGMLIGSIFWGSFCDLYGRKLSMQAFSSITFYFGILCAFAPNYIWLLLLRFLVGFGISGGPQVVTLLTEYLPRKWRALVLVFMQFFWAVGSCFESALALLVMPSLGWRYLVGFSAAPLIIFAVSTHFIPESARYLMISGRKLEALAVLEDLQRANFGKYYRARARQYREMGPRVVCACNDPSHIPLHFSGSGRSATPNANSNAAVIPGALDESFSLSSSASPTTSASAFSTATAGVPILSHHSHLMGRVSPPDHGSFSSQQRSAIVNDAGHVVTANAEPNSASSSTAGPTPLTDVSERNRFTFWLWRALAFIRIPGARDQRRSRTATAARNTAPRQSSEPSSFPNMRVPVRIILDAPVSSSESEATSRARYTAGIDAGTSEEGAGGDAGYGNSNESSSEGRVNLEPAPQERGRFKDLFSPSLRCTTLLLWPNWLIMALSYYGIVLLTTELFSLDDPCRGGQGTHTYSDDCYARCRSLSPQDYLDLLLTSFSEFASLFFIVFIVDWWGRKYSMAITYLAYALLIFILAFCVPRWIVTSDLFFARAIISGAFQIIYIYTPEVYPTSVRALGLGLCSSMARVGCIATPIIAQVLLKVSAVGTIALYAGLGAFAALLTMLLPIETMGRDTPDTVHTQR